MTDFLARTDIIVLLFAVAAVTYFTRSSGYLILSRFARIPPRLEAALEAVPAAVITALIVPPVVSGGLAELLAISVAGVASLRFAAFPVILAGLATLIAGRAIGL